MRLALLVMVLAGAAWVFVHRERVDADALAQWLRSFGLFVPPVFMALCAVGTVMLVPGSILMMAGGALFGPAWGVLYNLVGLTAGATLAFLISRYINADWVEHRAHGRLKALMEGVDAEGWRFVAFTRLMPVFPFFLLNYALGLTRIRLSHYVVTTLVCLLPAVFAFTWLGHAGRAAMAGGEGVVAKVLLAIGLLAAVVFLPHFVRLLRARRAARPGLGD